MLNQAEQHRTTPQPYSTPVHEQSSLLPSVAHSPLPSPLQQAAVANAAEEDVQDAAEEAVLHAAAQGALHDEAQGGRHLNSRLLRTREPVPILGPFNVRLFNI